MIEADKEYRVKPKGNVYGLTSRIDINYILIQKNTEIKKKPFFKFRKKKEQETYEYEFLVDYTLKDAMDYPLRHLSTLSYLIRKYWQREDKDLPYLYQDIAEGLEKNKKDFSYITKIFEENFEINEAPADWTETRLCITGNWFEPIATDSHRRFVLFKDKLTDNLYIGVHEGPGKPFTCISPYFGKRGTILTEKTFNPAKWIVYNREHDLVL